MQITSEELKRPAIVSLLAGIQWAGAAFWFLLTAVVTIGIVSLHASWLLAAIMLLLGLIAVALQVACGVGLWTLQPWGRTLQIGLACVGLFAFPVGTVVAILMLLYLTMPGIKIVFSGKPASERSPEEARQVEDVMRPARATIVLGAVGIVLSGLVWVMIVAAIAIPALLRARMTSNEKGAIAALTELSAAQTEYAADCGHGGYASSFDVLRTVLPDATVPSTQGFGGSFRGISGYWISLRQGRTAASGPIDCHGVPTVTAWYASATPQTFAVSGTRSFAINDGNVMWQTRINAPPAEPFGPPSTPVAR